MALLQDTWNCDTHEHDTVILTNIMFVCIVVYFCVVDMHSVLKLFLASFGKMRYWVGFFAGDLGCPKQPNSGCVQVGLDPSGEKSKCREKKIDKSTLPWAKVSGKQPA